jgi:hypothetical protein
LGSESVKREKWQHGRTPVDERQVNAMSLKELTYRVRVERTLRRPPTSANAGSNDRFMAAARYTHSLSCYLISVNGNPRLTHTVLSLLTAPA